MGKQEAIEKKTCVQLQSITQKISFNSSKPMQSAKLDKTLKSDRDPLNLGGIHRNIVIQQVEPGQTSKSSFEIGRT